MTIQFSKDQVIDRIRFENPWWKSGRIDDFYRGMQQRTYFQFLYPLINDRSIKRALVLMGPRRVGKTVLLYQSIGELIRDGVSPLDICYFSIETPLYNGIALEELVHLYFDIHDKTSSDVSYIFFDEIQYLKDWELHLKSLVDSYHHIKFIVSGSAAAALKLKSQESGAGRFTEFVLPPLTFQEFLALTDYDDIVENYYVAEGEDLKVRDIHEFNNRFLDYINYGGYPELSLSKAMQSDPGRYIRNDIIDKVLMRDLPSLYGINDIQELNSLFTYIAYNTGHEMSLDGLSKNSGVAKNTIKKYISYLEAAFLIKVIHRIDQNGKRFRRANFFKIYLTNPSIRSALFSPISANDEFMGNMVETAIFAQWQHHKNLQLYYARWNTGEVDIVQLDASLKPLRCAEIKWSNRFAKNPSALKNVRFFCERHQLTDAIITSINVQDMVEYKGIRYHFVPASQYCYGVGKTIVVENTLLKFY